MTRIYNLFGQGLLGFLPALVVAYMANYDIDLSAKMSFSFAAVGLCFSTFYFGQRAYIAINGICNKSESQDLLFRNINIIIASLIAIIISKWYGVTLWLFVLAISFKFSEAYIDLKNGLDINKHGSESAAKWLFISSLSRALLILLPLLFFHPSENNYRYFIVYYALVAFIFWFNIKIKHVAHNDTKQDELFSYIRNILILRSFAVATISCSFLSAAPRLVSNPDKIENAILLIALSISPAIAIIYQNFTCKFSRRAKY